MQFENREYLLDDDGTMDTVINVTCKHCGVEWAERLSCEAAGDYRDERGEMVDFELMIQDFFSCEDCMHCRGINNHDTV